MNNYFNDIDEYLKKINDYIFFQIEYLENQNNDIDAKEYFNLLLQHQLELALKTKNSIDNGIKIPLQSLIVRYKLSKSEVLAIMLALTSTSNPETYKTLKKLSTNNFSFFPTIALLSDLYRNSNPKENSITNISKLKNTFNIFFKNKNETLSLNTELKLNNLSLSAICNEPPYLPEFLNLHIFEQNKKDNSQYYMLDEILKFYENTPIDNVIVLNGAEGIGKSYHIRALGNFKNKNVLFVDTDMLLRLEYNNISDNFETIFNVAYLYDCIVCLNKKNLSDEYYFTFFIDLYNKLVSQDIRVFVCKSEKNEDKFLENVSNTEIVFDDFSFSMKKELFENSLKPKLLAEDVTISELCTKFNLTPKEIISACKEAKKLSDKKITSDTMYSCIYNQLTHSFENLAEKIKPSFRWEDVVLPNKLITDIKQACTHITLQNIVCDEWDFNKKIPYGQGLNMLFAGPPGTGKTMLSHIIANELNMELYRIDLSSIVSKYVGETEKNLSKIFDAGKKSNAILFFDEMDSLFGKRSETEDANDKYANMETAYLLQKIDEYKGVVLMATNYLNNIDSAFIRRIHFIFHIPFPSKEYREMMWKKIFPKNAPLSNDIDYNYLSDFEISGALIKNIAISGAYLAAANSSKINMYALLKALKYELTKQGKILLKSDFKEYAFLLDDEI